ncbi:MAG: serine hydrolase domain-containing protein [Psychromonas sp.]
MKLKKILLALSVCLPCVTVPLQTYATQSSALYEVFSADDLKNPRDFSGVAYITQGGNVLFNMSNNLLNNNENAAFNINTQFIIGSLSKQITATLVLRQVDKELLKLDDSISTYLPEIKQQGYSVVTLRHLLNHTSGITKLTHPLKTKPGEVFAYSNTGYNLLGKIVSVVSGQSYSSLAMQLFQQCGMKDSVSVAKNTLPPTSLVDGFHEKEIAHLELLISQFPYQTIPSGGVISTAHDLSKWNQCLHKSRLLSPEMHQEMVKKVKSRKHRWGDLGYGFALQLSTDLAQTEWSHSGYVKGYISTMSYYPDSDTSLIVLENISWYPKNMPRVFYYHDRLREELLSILAK